MMATPHPRGHHWRGDRSVTVQMDPRIKKAITAINDGAWKTIECTDAVYDENSQR